MLLNLPAEHDVHAEEVAPPVENDPAGQSSVHSDALAVVLLYLPASQSVHGPPMEY